MFKNLSNEALHDDLVQLSSVHNFLNTGLFQGHNAQHLVNAIRYIEHIHKQAETEYQDRDKRGFLNAVPTEAHGE